MTLISIEHSPVDEIEPTAKKVLDTMREAVWDKFSLDEKVTRVDRILWYGAVYFRLSTEWISQLSFR